MSHTTETVVPPPIGAGSAGVLSAFRRATASGTPEVGSETVRLADVPPWLLAVFAGGVAVLVVSGRLPNDMMGALGLLLVLGLLLGEAGDRLPIVNVYLGGGPIACIFVGALLAHWHALPAAVVTLCGRFLTETNFLNFYVACVITGAMLRMNRALFVGACLRFVPVLAAGLLVPMVVCVAVGALTGYGGRNALLYVVWPVLGGGVGAGAVPLAQVYSTIGGMATTDALSRMMPAVVLSNLVSIVIAAQLDVLGRAWPATTGRGDIIRTADLELRDRIERDAGTRRDLPLSPDLLGLGLIFTVGIYLVGVLIERLAFPAVHAFVWMIALLVVAKLSGVLPARVEAAGIQWNRVWVRNALYPVLVAVGIAFTDLGTVAALLRDPAYVALVVLSVVGATVGSGLAGHLTGLYFVESAIAGGLGMAAMGQTGDIACLSAARRMELLPFTTLSTRIGGALVLLLAGLQFALTR